MTLTTADVDAAGTARALADGLPSLAAILARYEEREWASLVLRCAAAAVLERGCTRAQVISALEALTSEIEDEPTRPRGRGRRK